MPNQEYVDIYSYSSGNGGGKRNRNQPPRRRKKKKSGWKKAVITIFSILLVLVGALVCVGWYFLGDLKIDTTFPKSDEELGLREVSKRILLLPISPYMELIPGRMTTKAMQMPP